MTKPLYGPGDLLRHNLTLGDHATNTYVVVNHYWVGGSYTYHLFCPQLDKDVYKTETVLQKNYRVVA